MVETVNDSSAFKPKASNQTPELGKTPYTQDLFQQLYNSTDTTRNVEAKQEPGRFDFKNLNKDTDVNNKVLTLAISPALKELPPGNVRADGSIAFDAVRRQDAPGKPSEAGVKRDAQGHVIEVDYANGKSRKFGYDDNGKLNQFTDVDGTVAKLDEKTGKWVVQHPTVGTTSGDTGQGHGPITGRRPQNPSAILESLLNPEGKPSHQAGSILDEITYKGGYDPGIRIKEPEFINPRVSDDGTFTYSTADGKQQSFKPDGTSTLSNPKDGSTVKKDANGLVTEIDYGDGKSRSFEYTKDKNGIPRITKLTAIDGKVYTLTDGKWLDAKGNDSGFSEITTTQDGKFKYTSAEGQTTTFATDGSRTVENPNHSKFQVDANGKISQVTYENGKTVSFGYSEGGELNKITGADGKTISKGKDGKWSDENGKDTGIKDVRLQPDGSYTYADKDNHLVINGTDGNTNTTTQTIDQIKKAAQAIHDAANERTLFVFGSGDGAKVNDIIQNMSTTDRLVLQQQYEQMYGNKLTDDISHNLNKQDAAKANELLYVANLKDAAARYIPNEAGHDGKNQRQAFLRNMDAFLDRAHKRGMSEEEIANTFAATQRLLEAKDGKVSQKLREQLAQQIMAEAAHPECTDQGYHNTCNATNIETRVWYTNPSVMANMVADVALTGSYTAADGKEITIPPQNLIPDGDAVDNPPRNGGRSFASQLIQAAICNDAGQRRNPPIYYTQLRPTAASSTGEFWTDANGKPLSEKVKVKEKEVEVPRKFNGISYHEIAQQLNHLTGTDHTLFVHTNVESGGDLVGFNNENELKEKLAQAKKEGKLPILIDVSSSDPLFGGAYGAQDTSKDKDGKPNRHRGNHVVCIDDYDPATGKVHIDNSWGSQYDKWTNIHELYNAST